MYCNQEILNQITKRKSIFIKKNDKIDESLKILKRQSATILNSLIKKSELFKLKKYFNENYNIIGDLDLLFRLSKNCKFKEYLSLNTLIQFLYLYLLALGVSFLLLHTPFFLYMH